MGEQDSPRKRNLLEKIYDTISKPFSISGDKNTLNIKKYITEKLSIIDESLQSSTTPRKAKKQKKALSKSFRHEQYSYSEAYQDRENETKSEHLSASVSSNNDEREEPELVLDDFFGANAENFIEEVRGRSIYRDLKSWKLVHLMVKTGDDIKQGTNAATQNSSPCS